MDVSMRDMLEAGAHFGHQTRRWNPKMRPYIYGAKNGIHVINLQKTYPLMKDAIDFVTSVVSRGDQIMFVGTKQQARDVVSGEARRAGMPFVTYRWLGGMMTNITTIRKSIQSIDDLDVMLAEGNVEKLPKKEVLSLEKRREKLLKNLEGIRDMKHLPKAMFIIDPNRERIALAESKKLGIPTVALVDTNCDPEAVDYPIPANDDAIKSIRLFSRAVADACLAGKELHQQAIMATTDKAHVAGMSETGDNVEVIVRGRGPRKKQEAPAAVAPEAPAPEAAPVVKEAAPVVKEAAPVVKEAAPVVKEAAPVVKEAAPVVKEAAPVVEEKAPEAAPETESKKEE